MNVGRRDFLSLGAVGGGALAGCIGLPNGEDEAAEDEPSPTATNEPETEEETPEPALYSEDDREEMIPSGDIFPEGWGEVDNEDWEAAYNNEDGTIFVLFDVAIANTVEEAKQGFERLRQRYDPNEYPVADEGFWAERADNARTIFRHSNAIGQAAAGRESNFEIVPDPGRSQRYAEEMYARWQALDTTDE